MRYRLSIAGDRLLNSICICNIQSSTFQLFSGEYVIHSVEYWLHHTKAFRIFLAIFKGTLRSMHHTHPGSFYTPTLAQRNSNKTNNFVYHTIEPLPS